MDDMLNTPFQEHFLDLFHIETYFPIIRNANTLHIDGKYIKE